MVFLQESLLIYFPNVDGITHLEDESGMRGNSLCSLVFQILKCSCRALFEAHLNFGYVPAGLNKFA